MIAGDVECQDKPFSHLFLYVLVLQSSNVSNQQGQSEM